MYISDLITEEDLRDWKTGDIITIKAGTGAGKSHFIKTRLFLHAKETNKKILMLIHRKNTVKQFREELKKEGKDKIVHVHTYQTLENISKFNINQYDYIVVDEFQYFLSDASFNNKTEISLDKILLHSDKVRILMSATGEMMIDYLENKRKLELIKYELPVDYEKIKKLRFFNKDSNIEKFIQSAIKNNIKAMFFINDTEKAYQLHKKYQDHTLFNCSKNQTKYYKYVSEDKIEEMLVNEKFKELILITTTVMDVGVNIKDKDLHNIVISNINDVEQVIQCIGRKRIMNNDDYINLFIQSIDNQQLGRRKGKLVNRIKQPLELMESTVGEFTNKYTRSLEMSDILYDDVIEGESHMITKKVNRLMLYKCQKDIETIDKMVSLGRFGYNEYISRKLGIDYKLLDFQEEKMELEKYLDNIKGKKLYKDVQQELIEIIDLRVNGRRQRSYKKLNEGLNMINVNYIILPKKSGSIRYWIVDEIEK